MNMIVKVTAAVDAHGARELDDRNPVGIKLDGIAKLSHVRENKPILEPRDRLKSPEPHGLFDD